MMVREAKSRIAAGHREHCCQHSTRLQGRWGQWPRLGIGALTAGNERQPYLGSSPSAPSCAGSTRRRNNASEGGAATGGTNGLALAARPNTDASMDPSIAVPAGATTWPEVPGDQYGLAPCGRVAAGCCAGEAGASNCTGVPWFCRRAGDVAPCGPCCRCPCPPPLLCGCRLPRGLLRGAGGYGAFGCSARGSGERLSMGSQIKSPRYIK